MAKTSDNIWKHIVENFSDREFVPRGMPEPTKAIPGSAEKIAVLSARVEAGLALHHPEDYTVFQQKDPWKLPEIKLVWDSPRVRMVEAE